MTQQYKVEHLYSSGWGDAEWTESDSDGNISPMRFNSIRSAEEEINQHILDCKYSVKRGFMDDVPLRKHYRAVEA